MIMKFILYYLFLKSFIIFDFFVPFLILLLLFFSNIYIFKFFGLFMLLLFFLLALLTHFLFVIICVLCVGLRFPFRYLFFCLIFS